MSNGFDGTYRIAASGVERIAPRLTEGTPHQGHDLVRQGHLATAQAPHPDLLQHQGRGLVQRDHPQAAAQARA